MAPTDVPKKERSLSYRLHDALNVPLVGGLAIMCILGLLGLMDAHLITKIFISYIAVDTIWIVLSPSAVPRFAWAIVLHHVLTFLILLHPLRFPEHAIETCRDGIVELNTFFLIARRQLTRGSLLNRACDLMYHLTLSIVPLAAVPHLSLQDHHPHEQHGQAGGVHVPGALHGDGLAGAPVRVQHPHRAAGAAAEEEEERRD